MCGIAGIVHSDPSHPVSFDSIRAMCDAIASRGPDHFGHRIEGHVGLGMRRLSIIDLRSGEQPIANEDGTIWIVFNGEIYNYRELRTELRSRGHRFRTASDTEVIVHLYEEFGERCVHQLRGMFAFAIWDSRQRTLMLARDRLGIKPLYYSHTPDGLLFGSELKALLTQPSVSRTLNVEAMWEYFTHLCVPGGLSIFQEVLKLPPAHILTYVNGETRLTRYWHVGPAPQEAVTESEWVERLRAHLKDAVASHMVADVPVGAFLSGGLDSGTMVALMSEAVQEPIRTFTVGFASQSGPFDERDAARLVAERYRTKHHECLLEADVVEVLPKIVSAFDEPFADSSAVPNWLVCQETARHVKVAMSGLGADELFGGYERYVGLALGETFQRLPSFLRRILVRLLSRWPSGDGLSYRIDRIKRFLAASDRPATERYRNFIAAFADPQVILHPDVLASVGAKPHRFDHVMSELAVRSPLDIGLFADLYLYLPDDLLPLSDRVSMAHSLEVRVPFLDHQLVEFAATIPARYKVRGMKKKYLFRKAIVPWLPAEHFSRPKQGFSIPVAAWLRGPLRPMLEDVVGSRRCRESRWLDHKALSRVVAEHVSGKENHESRLWAVLCFQEWERQYLAV